MTISAIENSGVQPTSNSKTPSSDALRQAAVQFEAILLMQLTSVMNGTGEADEDSLFGNDGGSDLAKKMFSEQMATTIANSGGVGLADTIMQQFGAKQTPSMINTAGGMANVIAAVKDIKETNVAPNKNLNALGNSNSNRTKNSVSTETFTGDPNDFEVISTFADEIIKEDGADGLKPFMYNGQIMNTTRPRIAPEPTSLADKNLLSIDVNSPVNSGDGKLQMPVAGRLSSDFGTRFHPIDRRMKMHTGIDIAAPRGTPIKVAGDGVVTFAGRKNGYGNVVIVEHADGRETFYAHADKIFVEEGQTVSVGTTIASVGSTGKSTGPHLHFEVRENNRPVDPSKYLSKVL